MKVIRLMAQLIDLLAALGIFLASFVLALPVLSRLISSAALCAVLILLLSVGLIAAVQLLFLRDGQTIGKAFFGLRVESTVATRPLTPSILVQREIFCKLMSCYFLCIPMLWGNPGGHEEATQTRVVRAPKKVRA